MINVKGGTGKTTSTIYLATVLARRELPVMVWDLDRQASALEWAERAADNGEPLGFKVEIAIPRQLIKMSQSLTSDEFVLIDTPPGDIEAIDASIRVADFIVIPTKSREADMSRTWRTISVIQEKPHAVLLTHVRARTSSFQEARDVLEDNHVSFFDTSIPLREKIGKSYGERPGQDLFGYEQVINEIMEGR